MNADGDKQLPLPDHTAARWDEKSVAYFADNDTAVALVVEPLLIPWAQQTDDGPRVHHSVLAGKFIVHSPAVPMLGPGDVVVMGSDPLRFGVEAPSNVAWQIVYRAAYNHSPGWWLFASHPDLAGASGLGEWTKENSRDALMAAVCLSVQRSLDARLLGWTLWQFGDQLVYDRLVSVTVAVNPEGVPATVRWEMEVSGKSYQANCDLSFVDTDRGPVWDAPPMSWLGGPMVAFGDEPAFAMVDDDGRVFSHLLDDMGQALAFHADGEGFAVLEMGTTLTVSVPQNNHGEGQ